MKSKFKIASFNIQHGAIISYNWARLVSPVICIGADLLGVQEVDMGVQRSHCVDTVQEICKALAWKDGRFVRSMSYDGGQYGNAMFGRDRFDTFETCMLPYREDLEPRSCGHATVRLDNGLLLHFFNTHLSYQTEESRFSQFQFIKNAIDCIPENETYIITGDFNTQDESEFTPLLTGRAVLTNQLSVHRKTDEQHFKTFPESGRAIDNIIYDSYHLSLENAGMNNELLSDHNLLWAEFSSQSS